MVIKSNRLPQLSKQLAKLADKKLQVGVFDSDPRQGEDISNAELAIIHTYGTETLPARPFIEPALKSHKQQYAIALKALCAKAVKEAATKGVDPNAETLLASLAGRAINDVKTFIKQNKVKPPDTEETKQRKGSDITLIDSGQLVNSIEGRIV